ncbi:hypothetical protein GCM10009760_60530 [Kitasatospora kazusensis]|uniref:Uncharacterized protein n=1 Tax=Kitasatospora kazusensis TaxID=407974 RepID=A0ABP5M0C7_9ACTN
MEFEDRLGTMLGESLSGLPVPVAVMVAEAGRRGRRLRLRRRIAQLAATVAVVAGLVCGSALLDVRTRPAAAAVQRPVDLADRDLLGTLATLLPAGASLRQYEDAGQQDTGPQTPGQHAPAGTGLTLAYDGGHGPLTLAVTLYGPLARDVRPGCDSSTLPVADRTECTVVTVGPGRSEVTQVFGGGAWYGYDIWATGADGVKVHLTVRQDSPAADGSLTLAQWQQIARSPRWAIGAGPADRPQPGTGS